MGDRTRRFSHQLGGLLAPADADAELLGRFTTGRDAEAFAALVRRHGPMVAGVCRRILRDPHAADDAFQATFLVLARRAASLRDRALLANWLYGVAYRTALEARRAEAIRRVKETRAAAMTDRTAGRDEPAHDLRDVLDKELAALPDVYRAAVVLCDLEGLPRAEAAKRLGWTEGTLSGRLARARALLAKRLAKYGLSAAGVVAAAGVAEGVSGALVESTARAAVLAAAGEALAGVVPVSVVELSQGVVKAMYVSKLKGLVAGVMVAGAVAWTGAVGSLSEASAGPQTTPSTKKAAERPGKDRDADRIAQLERERDALLKKLADMEARLNALEAAQKEVQSREAVARREAQLARDQLERLSRAAERALVPSSTPAPQPVPSLPTPLGPTSEVQALQQIPPAPQLALPTPTGPVAQIPPSNIPTENPPPLSERFAVQPTGIPDPLPNSPPHIEQPVPLRPTTTNALPPPSQHLPNPVQTTPAPRGNSMPTNTIPAATTPAPQRPTSLKVYPIEDLVSDGTGSEAVTRIIQATIEPRSWQQMGGDGVIEYFPAKKALVVRQTQEVHKQLTELLSLLRDKPTDLAPPRKK